MPEVDTGSGNNRKTYGFLIAIETEDKIDPAKMAADIADVSLSVPATVDVEYLGEIDCYEEVGF